MKQALKYSLRVWLTAVIAVLAITWITDIVAPYAISDYLYNGFFGRITEILLFTLAFAIPFFLCVRFLFVFQQKTSSVKAILSFATLALGWLPVVALTILIDEPVSIGYKLGTIVYICLLYTSDAADDLLC